MSTRQIWTAIQHNGPNHLGLWSIRTAVGGETFRINALTSETDWHTQVPPQHGLSSKKMTLITSDYGIMCYLRIKWL